MGLGIGKGSPDQFCWKCFLLAAHLDGSLQVGENPPSQYNINIHLSELVWFCMALLLTRHLWWWALNRSRYLEFVPWVRMRTSFHRTFLRATMALVSTCYLTNCHGQMTLQPLEEHKTHLTRSHRGQMSLEQTWFQECLFHAEKEVWNWVTVLVADHPIASKFSFAPGEFWAGDPHTTEEGLKVYVCTIGESLSICWTSVVLNKSFAVEQCETLPIVWC